MWSMNSFSDLLMSKIITRQDIITCKQAMTIYFFTKLLSGFICIYRPFSLAVYKKDLYCKDKQKVCRQNDYCFQYFMGLIIYCIVRRL